MPLDHIQQLRPDSAPYFTALREERVVKSVNLRNLEGFVAKVRGNAGAERDPEAYLRANSAHLQKLFQQACVNAGPVPAHLTGIQASDFSLAIAEIDASAERWAVRQAHLVKS